MAKNKLLRQIHDVPWMATPNLYETWSSDEFPPAHLVTAAFAVVRKGDSFLFVRYSDDATNARQYDLPGGHIEKGESIGDAVVREVLEEACVKVRPIRPIGYYRCFKMSEESNDGRYPSPESFMAVLLCELESEEAFVGQHETIGREYFTIDELRKMNWRQDQVDLLESIG